MRGLLAGLLLLAASVPARAETGPFLTLDAVLAPAPGFVPEAAPRRLVILDDGTVYVGGSRHIAVGRLEKPELKALEKRLEKLRKQQPGLSGEVSFGAGSARYHLVVSKGQALDVTSTGDPAAAPFNLRPLAGLVADLAAFGHPSLHPYEPAFFAVKATPGTLAGGCRFWSLPVSLEDSVATPQPLSGGAAADWPTGAVASSVCSDDKSYVVTLRPLLPGERP